MIWFGVQCAIVQSWSGEMESCILLLYWNRMTPAHSDDVTTKPSAWSRVGGILPDTCRPEGAPSLLWRQIKIIGEWRRHSHSVSSKYPRSSHKKLRTQTPNPKPQTPNPKPQTPAWKIIKVWKNLNSLNQKIKLIKNCLDDDLLHYSDHDSIVLFFVC